VQRWESTGGKTSGGTEHDEGSMTSKNLWELDTVDDALAELVGGLSGCQLEVLRAVAAGRLDDPGPVALDCTDDREISPQERMIFAKFAPAQWQEVIDRIDALRGDGGPVRLGGDGLVQLGGSPVPRRHTPRSSHGSE
jgi:hypothetical protein